MSSITSEIDEGEQKSSPTLQVLSFDFLNGDFCAFFGFVATDCAVSKIDSPAAKHQTSSSDPMEWKHTNTDVSDFGATPTR